MATLALSVAGSAVGGALLPAGISVSAPRSSGAAIGSRIGALAGNLVDQALFGTRGQTAPGQGPAALRPERHGLDRRRPNPRVYGRARLGGQMIWATDIEEEVVTAEAAATARAAMLAAAPTRTTSTAISPISPSACARARSRHRPRVGRRQGARSHRVT